MAYRNQNQNQNQNEDEDEDEWEEDDNNDGDAFNDEEDEPTVPCPFCRQEILEDAPWCPHCDRYISAEDHARAGKPLWVIVAAVLCLAIAVWWVVAVF